jgi:hypothetical protein
MKGGFPYRTRNGDPRVERSFQVQGRSRLPNDICASKQVAAFLGRGQRPELPDDPRRAVAKAVVLPTKPHPMIPIFMVLLLLLDIEIRIGRRIARKRDPRQLKIRP